MTIQIFWDVTLVLWYTFTEISKCCSTFVSSVKQCSNFLTLNMKSPLSLEKSRTIYPTTVRNMSEEWIFSNTAVRTSILTTCHVCNSTFGCMTMFLHRCVCWHGTVVSVDMVLFCWLTWYYCVDWHGNVVSIDMVPLCRVTWYCCVVWHGTIVSIDMVLLYCVTWYCCVIWHSTVVSI